MQPWEAVPAALPPAAQRVLPLVQLVGSGAGDASTRQLPFTTRLVAQLAGEVEAAGVLAGAFGANAARDAGSGHLLSRHPKFRALTELLLEYRDRPTFHGILFARTREDVRSLARQLRAAPDLHFLQARCLALVLPLGCRCPNVRGLHGAAPHLRPPLPPPRCTQVHELMGHGNRRGGGGDMTSKAQQVRRSLMPGPGCGTPGMQLAWLACRAPRRVLPLAPPRAAGRHRAVQGGGLPPAHLHGGGRGRHRCAALRVCRALLGGADGCAGWRRQQRRHAAGREQPSRTLAEACSEPPRRLAPAATPCRRSGRERLQSAGRARKHGSLFVEIIEDAPEERAQVRKARAEVAHLNAALAGLAVASSQL